MPVVPRLSEFYGIVIAMYFEDHPPVHFHAFYAGQWAVVVVDPVAVCWRADCLAAP